MKEISYVKDKIILLYMNHLINDGINGLFSPTRHAITMPAYLFIALQLYVDSNTGILYKHEATFR